MSVQLPRTTQIRRALGRLQHHGVITDYDIQSNMPGLRWVLYGLPFYGTGRAYTTAEVEVFIDGAMATVLQGDEL